MTSRQAQEVRPSLLMGFLPQTRHLLPSSLSSSDSFLQVVGLLVLYTICASTRVVCVAIDAEWPSHVLNSERPNLRAMSAVVRKIAFHGTVFEHCSAQIN